jgi:uncharacterized protein YndB with AHSA1/START domain
MTTEPKHVLTLKRVIDAPVAALWRCWTEPDLLNQWFCPKPWYVTDSRVDLRPGGEFFCVMNGPDGERFENLGVCLEAEPQRRLVFTDAFKPGWIPSDRAFITSHVDFEDAGQGRTNYTWRALHWSEETMKEHEAMGFHEGWGKAADQLAELAKAL